MGDIIIRGLPNDIIARLDKLAGTRSRNEFLKQQLISIAMYPELKEQADAYTELVTATNDALKENSELFRVIIDVLQEAGKDKT